VPLFAHLSALSIMLVVLQGYLQYWRSELDIQIWNGSRSVDYPRLYMRLLGCVGMVRIGDASLVSLPDCDFVTLICSV